jgi:transcription elongation factor SPT5
MAVQIAKAVGARVIAVVGGEEKAEVARSSGADAVVDYRDEGWEDKVIKMSDGGEGVDVVYDGIGAVESGIRCLRYRGRLVIVGFAARGGKMESVRTNRVLLKGIAVFGYVSSSCPGILFVDSCVLEWCANLGQRFGEDGRRNPQRTRDVWDGFMKLVEGGKIRPVIYKENYRGLEAVSRALEDVRVRKAWGRAVVRVSGDDEDSNEEKARL